MFRSTNLESDLVYNQYGLTQLLSNSPKAISKDNPLLYLLSIVDTIECTKCFQNLSLPFSSRFFNLKINIILDNVFIDLINDSIIIDYSQLNDAIDNYWAFFKREEKKSIMKNKLKSLISLLISTL